MAHLLYDFLTEIDTQQYPQIICGHDQSDDLVVIVLEPHVDTQQTVHQPVTHGEKRRCYEQGHKWFNDPNHLNSSLPVRINVPIASTPFCSFHGWIRLWDKYGSIQSKFHPISGYESERNNKMDYMDGYMSRVNGYRKILPVCEFAS